VLVPVTVAGLVVLFTWVIAVGRRQERRERVVIEAWAAQLGLRFSAEDCLDLPKRFGDFWQVLQRGFATKAANLVWGKTETGEVILFDLKATSTNGKGTDWTVFACCYCELPRPVASMTIRHRGCLDTLGRWFGYHEIQFESAEFNRVWCIESDDHHGVCEVITPQVMEFIMGSGIYCLMTNGNRAMAVLQGRTLTPARCGQLLAQAQGFARHLPAGNVGEARGQPIV
jgi:hypothetical protein